MPQSGTKSPAKTKKGRAASPPPADLPDVLTSAEAAEYLRVSEDDVLELAARGDLPGRKIKHQWRFSRLAVVDWLCRVPSRDRLLRHAGAAKDDPYLDEIVERIYHDRGRPIAEDGE